MFLAFSGGNILIVGGWTDKASAKAEIVDKSGNSKVLPDLPHAANWATGGLLDGQPVICGGNTGVGKTYHDECYKLSHDGLSWQQFATLDVPRAEASSIILEDKIWINGGVKARRDYLKSSVLLDINGGISQGPDLPEPLVGHSTIKINDKIMVIGGSNGKEKTNKTRIYNLDLSFEKEGPELDAPRSHHGCCSVASRNHNGNTVVLVAGGRPELRSVELLDCSKPGSSWQKSKLD